jgi:thioredoxin
MSEFMVVNDANFKTEVLESKLPVLVEFGAAWCQPCNQLEPLLKQLADGWQGKVRLAHVNVDEASDLVMRFGVMSVPTTLLFIGGQPKERLTGFQPKEKMLAKLTPHLQGLI